MGRRKLIQLRRDASTDWSTVNPILADGEPGYDRDNNVLKVGDGVTAWNNLGAAGGGTVEHVWASQGTSGWSPMNINPGNPDGSTVPATLSVSGLKGRTSRSQTGGNEREVFVRDGTDWADSEIRSTLYGPDAATWAAPNDGVQTGHVHRAQLMDDGVHFRGIVITQNVIFSGIYIWNIGVWNGTSIAGTVHIKAGTSMQPQVLGQSRILAVERYSNAGVWTDRFYVDSIDQCEVGDTVSVYGLATTAFNRTDLTVTLVQPGPIGGAGVLGKGKAMIECTKTGTTAAVVAFTPDLGVMSPAFIGGTIADVKFANPVKLASRVVGTDLWVKAWRADHGEPDWEDPWSSTHMDFSGALVEDGSGNPMETPTGPGKCGIVSNHLYSGAAALFGDVTMKAL